MANVLPPKIEDYLGHAKDCAVLAGSATTDEHRKLLQEMANTWRILAREHARMIGHQLTDAPKEVQTEAPPASPFSTINLAPGKKHQRGPV